MAKKSPRGSTLDSLFEELGETSEVRKAGEAKQKAYRKLLAQKKRLAAKVESAMTAKNMTQTALAQAMETSRTVVHRLLDSTDTSITLATVFKAQQALGVELLRVP
jgi:DNA-binding Xre family transcriptional regulator